MATELVTPAELASWLQEDVDTATANLLISQATSLVQEAAAQTLVQVVGDVLELEGQAGPWLDLPQRPVTAIASVVLQAGTGIPNTLGPTEYVQVGHRLWRQIGWRCLNTLPPVPGMPFHGVPSYPPPSIVKVTCDHGYAPGDMRLEPARTAVLALCAQAYTNPGGSRSVTVDDYTETYSDQFAGMQMPESTRKLLRRRYGLTAMTVVPR